MTTIVDRPNAPRRQTYLKWVLAVGLVATLSAAPAAFAAEKSPLGTWINDTGRGAIEIKSCGDKLCGHVVWVKDQTDAAKGCGKQIIGDVVKTDGNRWDGGWIYSPERKNSYSVALQPLNDGTLRVIGNANSRFFSRTMIWTPAAVDLQRCDRQATKSDASPPTATQTSTATPAPTATEIKEDVPQQAAKQTDQSKIATPEPQVVKPSAPTSEREATPPDQHAPQDQHATGGDAPTDGPHPKTGTRIGGIDLDTVFTRTSAGRCKLDLPWIKLDVRCDRD